MPNSNRRVDGVLECYPDLSYPIEQMFYAYLDEHPTYIGVIHKSYICSTKEAKETLVKNLGDKFEIAHEGSTSCAPTPSIINRRKFAASWYFLYHCAGGSICPVGLELERKELKIRIGYQTDDEAKEILDKILEVFPEEKEPPEGTISIDFWVKGNSGGPRKIRRNLQVLPFSKIQDNYDAKTKALLTKMIAFKPEKGGQILLFTGEPGTGKTHSLRSLMWEWKDWAEFHYIVDSSTFFGNNPDYFMKIVFDEFDDSGDSAPLIRENLPGDLTKWRVIILEDAGSLFSLDAKNELGGSGLSSLLNLTDGMLGQGLNLLFIFTTNEEMNKLQPAVSRPGRCAVKHKDDKLEVELANEWLKAHGSAETTDKPLTIAELYAKTDITTKDLEGNMPETKDKKILGFSKE